MTRGQRLELLHGDAHDRRLIRKVHPPDWVNPTPAGRYNLVVIGAGPAGLTAVRLAVRLGARVALVERNLFGGGSLNVGCVPSKALLRTGRFQSDLGEAARYLGTPIIAPEPDFAAAMARLRRIRAHLATGDSAQRYRDLGVDVFIGEASFETPSTVRVGDARLRFAKALIATGARPLLPEVPGIDEAGYLTNETVFNLTKRPRRLLVIGGGPLGCELAQAFARLGCVVTLAQREPWFLPVEERDAADILADALRRDGIDVRLNTEVRRVTRLGDEKGVVLYDHDHESTIVVDEILAGVGRRPNTEGLNLEAAGIEYDLHHGVKVDDRLRTTNRRVYAAGDVALDRRFTHLADTTARLAVRNALFFGRGRISELVVPWCTYTDPEIAHVGVYVNDERARGHPMKTFTVPMADVDRAVLDGEDEGFVKIHVREGTDTILGCTIVARHAGEMINEISLAMVAGIGLKTVARVIHSYPTQAEAIRYAGDAYNVTRFTPLLRRISAWWLSWTR